MQRKQRHIGSLGATLLIILLSTGLLYLIVGQHGALIGTDDSSYLGGAINIAQGNGFAQSNYDVDEQSIVLRPITHYPPLFSLSYAALLTLGVPLVLAPSLLALACWVALLSGIGLLTYRLSHSAVLAVLAIALAAVTHAYLTNFTRVFSEVLYVPLLVWSMVVLVDLHELERGILPRLALAALLLAGVMLTRYVGIIAWGSTMLWWGWCRWQQQQPRRLLYEWPLLGAAVVPLGLFLLRNQMVTTQAVGSHFSESDSGFVEGVLRVLDQGFQLLLPALPAPSEWFVTGIPKLILLVVSSLFLGVLLLQARMRSTTRQQLNHWQPPRSPMLLIIGFYVALYTLVQPFMSFTPIDDRDMMTLLCLGQPLLLTAIGQLFQQHARRVASVFVGANLLLVLVPVLLVGIPGGLLRLNPPQIADLSHNMDEAPYYYQRGIPLWMLVLPFRMTSLERYHPEVAAYVREHDMQIVTVTNSLRASLYPDSQHQPPPRLFLSVEHWLAEGTCTPPVDTIVVVFDWNSNLFDAEQTLASIEQKCPQVTPMVMENSTIYELSPVTTVTSP